MTWILFIDDLRSPSYVGLTGDRLNRTIIARDSREAIRAVLSNGVPSEVYFDHDLGGDDTSMRFVRWLIDYDLVNDLINKSNFTYHVHSSNPVGKENIEGALEHYLQWKNNITNNPF